MNIEAMRIYVYSVIVFKLIYSGAHLAMHGQKREMKYDGTMAIITTIVYVAFMMWIGII